MGINIKGPALCSAGFSAVVLIKCDSYTCWIKGKHQDDVFLLHYLSRLAPARTAVPEVRRLLIHYYIRQISASLSAHGFFSLSQFYDAFAGRRVNFVFETLEWRVTLINSCRTRCKGNIDGKNVWGKKKKSDFCTASVKDEARGPKCSPAIGLMWPKVVDWTGQNEDAAPLKTQDRNDNNVVVFKLSDWFDFLNYPSLALMSYGR